MSDSRISSHAGADGSPDLGTESTSSDSPREPSEELSPAIKWLGLVLTTGIVLCVAIGSIGVSVGWWLHYRETLESTSPGPEQLATPGPRTSSDASSNSATGAEHDSSSPTSDSSDDASSTSEDNL